MTENNDLKSMLNNLINDKPEEASLDFHNYLVGKMKVVSGIQSTEEVEEITEAVESKYGIGVNRERGLSSEELRHFHGTKPELFKKIIAYLIKECNDGVELGWIADLLGVADTKQAVKQKLESTKHFDALVKLLKDSDFEVMGPVVSESTTESAVVCEDIYPVGTKVRINKKGDSNHGREAKVQKNRGSDEMHHVAFHVGGGVYKGEGEYHVKNLEKIKD